MRTLDEQKRYIWENKDLDPQEIHRRAKTCSTSTPPARAPSHDANDLGACSTDVKIRHITIPHEYIGEQFRRLHRMAIRERFDPMAELIAAELDIKYGIAATTAERNQLKRGIRAMFAGGAGDLQLYKEFFEWLGRPEMFRMRRGHTLEHSDLAPMAWLHIILDGVKPRTRVKHLLIDEMQDYTPVQYRVIQRLFPCRKTLLGDAGQSVDPHGSSTAETIARVFADS